MPSFGRFGRDLAYGDQPLADGTLTLMIRTPPGLVGRLSGAEWQRAGLVWHTQQVAGAPGGANVWLTG
jgi:hypothetical protein